MQHIRPKNPKKKKFSTYCGAPPGLDSPVEWFDFTDTDQNGRISQEQVITSLCATLHASSNQRIFIRNKVQESWTKFDRNHDMQLSKSEFLSRSMVTFLMRLERDFAKTHKKVKSPEAAMNRRVPVGQAPPLSNGKRWFDHYDISRDKLLSKEEVINALFELLKAKSSKEQDAIRHTIEKAWVVFDDDGSGQIDRWEFLGKGGLNDYLILLEKEWKERPNDRNTYNFLNLYAKGGRRHNYLPPPSLATDSEKWFYHFDFDYSGSLSQKEVIHSLIVTLNANTSEHRRTVRELIVGAWDKYDKDDDNLISKEEFLANDGLVHMFINLEKEWKLNQSPEAEEKSNADKVVIKAFVPAKLKSGDIMKVSSPKTQEMVLLMIPDKILWSGGGEEPYYFSVNF